LTIEMLICAPISQHYECLRCCPPLIQMEHKDTSQSKVRIKLNILRLLGNLLLNKHCSTFRAFQMPIELVGNFRLHRKLNFSSQVFFCFQALPKTMHSSLKHQGVGWNVLYDTHVYRMGCRSWAPAIFVLLYLGVLFQLLAKSRFPIEVACLNRDLMCRAFAVPKNIFLVIKLMGQLTIGPVLHSD
jgi:hypothetical protein